MSEAFILPAKNHIEVKGYIAVVDDDPEMRSLIEDFLHKHDYIVHSFPAGGALLDFLKSQTSEAQNIELVISDIQMPQINGIELTAKIKELNPELPVILVTGFGSIESAIQAMKNGAFDYITKPFKLNEMTIHIERALSYYRLHHENKILKGELSRTYQKGSMVGKSKSMEQIFELVQRVSHATSNILVTGESGTGKELVARSIHNLGSRADQPFIAVNCTAIPEGLLESELFGTAKGDSGGGTSQRKLGLFEEAEGGTIFLDEIGDMVLPLQAKLLRVIQERKIRPVGDTITKDIDVRIIAATHKDLKASIKQGLFREDLYYRLSVIPIHIPPLRHRKEDIPILANHFLKKYVAQNGLKPKSFSQRAILTLMDMRWDGNVRELENLIERIVVMNSGSIIHEADIPLPEMENVENFFGDASRDMPTLEQLEKRYIQIVMTKTGGKKDKTAHILGINRRTLYRKEREYGFTEHSDDEISTEDQNQDENLNGSDNE